MADEFLQRNGKYLQCVACADDQHYLARQNGRAELLNADGTVRERRRQGFSYCLNCDSAQNGCDTCTAYRGSRTGIFCKSCESGFHTTGTGTRKTFENCGYLAQNCGKCNAEECLACKEGYYYIFGNCEKNWF